VTEPAPDLTPQQVAQEQLGAIALHASRNQGQNLKQILRGISACDKAIAGLPNLVEANEEAVAGIESVLETALSEISAMWVSPDLPQETKERLGELHQITTAFHETHRMFAKCLINLAKTQIGFAKILKHDLSMSLIYVQSEDHLTDCAELANKVGKSDEALQDLWQQKVAKDEPREFGFQDDA